MVSNNTVRGCYSVFDMVACKTERGIEHGMECGTDVKVLISPWWGLIGGSITEPLVVMVACIHSSEFRQAACSCSPHNVLQSSIDL